MHPVDSSVAYHRIGILHLHAFFPLNPRTGQYAAKESGCGFSRQIRTIVHHAIFKPPQLRVGNDIVVRIQRYGVIISPHLAIFQIKPVASPQMDAILTALYMNPLQAYVLKSTYLDSKRHRTYVKSGEICYFQILHIEKRHISHQPQYRLHVITLIYAVHLYVKTRNLYVLIIRPVISSSVHKHIRGRSAIAAVAFVYHHSFRKYQFRV